MRGLVSAILLSAAIACGNAPAAFGPDAEKGRANASDMLEAFAVRFTNAKRVGTLDHIHDEFVRHALFPSRLINDSSLWSSRRGPTRGLSVYGTQVGAQYHLAARANAPHPARTGDIRIDTHLSRLGPSEYQWAATSDLAIGTLTSADFFRGIAASLAELEVGAERALRAEYHATLPRTTSALGVLFSVDSVRSLKRSDGSTEHRLTIGMDIDRARKAYPTFGKYLNEYVKPARYRLLFTDRTGARWLEAKAGDDQLILQLRTRDGQLLPLEGPARPLPAALQLNADLTLHILFFDVGMSSLLGDVEVVRSPNENGFAVRFRREPKWHFPLATDRLIKTPLRRPFAGEGALFRLTVRDSADAQTVMSRQVGMAVQESAILRWLARLNRTAADDFTASADVESNRFLSDVFTALRNDVRMNPALQARAGSGGGEP